jgi:hypothetical protein
LQERWEGGAVIACVFGRSLERVEGRRTAREMSGIVTLTLFFVFGWELPDSFVNGGSGGGERSKCFLAMCNGVGFQMNDLVDVFVGTGKGVTGNKAFPTKARFKGVRVEKGEERFLCRPIVGSQKGRCPSFPPESCLKMKAFGSDVYGERKLRFFSKLTIEVQERLPLPAHSPLPPKPKPQKTPDL